MGLELSIADLNTTINHEPRVLDLTLADRLGMADAHKVRPLIQSNMGELITHGEVSARRAETSARGGRPGKEYWLNEPQALLVCMFSRTPRAAEVRKQVIDVFIEWRRSQLKPVKGDCCKVVTVREHQRRMCEEKPLFDPNPAPAPGPRRLPAAIAAPRDFDWVVLPGGDDRPVAGQSMIHPRDRVLLPSGVILRGRVVTWWRARINDN